MKTTIYIDTLFCLNLLLNYMLLLAAVRLTDAHFRRWRLWLAAAFGGAYAVVVFLPAMSFAQSAVCKILSAALMGLIAVGGLSWRKFLRFMGVFLGVSFALAGGVTAIGTLTGNGGVVNGVPVLPIHLPTLLLAFAGCYLLLTLAFRRAARHGSEEILPVSARWGDCAVTFSALRDTGNTLTDPMTGAPVLVADWERVLPLLPREVRPLFDDRTVQSPAEALEYLALVGHAARWRLIPYRSVGTEANFLLALRPDEIKIGGKPRRGMLIALSPNALSDGAAYSAIVGAV